MMKVVVNPNTIELVDILKRKGNETNNLNDVVMSIVNDVRCNGDDAVRRYTKQYDRAKIDDFFVRPYEIKFAEQKLSVELKEAIVFAAKNIRQFHESQKETIRVVETVPGVKCWRKSVGIEKVGLYIPGGSAPLFSTVLMLGVPAQIAGCEEVVLFTPPGINGEIHAAVLFAAKIAGITKIVRVGGIQAIAAMTFGTESIPKVDKIFGPGNQYVTAAKQYVQSFGIAIDLPAGPSELMVVADGSANSAFVASDLLSQAEHGMDSQVVLLSSSSELIKEVLKEIEIQTEQLGRKEVVKKSLLCSVAILVGQNRFSEIINDYAPEHLILNTKDNESILPEIKNAGSVFIGPFTPESAGDYASGTNHTLPTNGFARQYSGVSLDSFVKKITFQEISVQGLKNLGKTIEVMAQAEGLQAHKNAVTVRLNKINDGNY